MLHVHVPPDMMANLRFAYSPLLELTISYRILKGNWQQALYWRWIEEAHRALDGLDLPYMDALILPRGDDRPQKARGYVPDFLTPTPPRPITDIEDEFDRLRHMDIDLIRDGLLIALDRFGPGDILCDFLAFPHEHMTHLIQELREYWKRTLAHHWNRMITVLENDVLHHSRVLTLHGLETLFPGLDPLLGYEPGVLRLNFRHGLCKVGKPVKADEHRELNASNLWLVPVIFSGNAIYTQLNQPWQPMIIYTARGAALWNYETPDPIEALEITLGEGKARVLLALNSPLSTGELARTLSLTAGAVSQQLGKLHQAGLVESHRNGKHVFYRLTERGSKLVELFC